MVDSTGNESSFLGGVQEPLINITEDTFITLNTSLNSKGFGNSVPETGKKAKYIFLTINHSIVERKKTATI